MEFKEFIDDLKHKISKGLAGKDAQMIMAPASREIQMKNLPPGLKASKASVLILFYPDGENIMLPFIKRPEYDGVHSGQIAFPGGKKEKDDKSMTDTALREAHEEIGIKIDDVHIIGPLSELYIPPSNYIVTPIAAYTDHKPDYSIDKSEVDLLLLFELSELLNPGAVKQHHVMTGLNLSMPVPCFSIHGHIIWGATAMMLSELKAIISR